MCYHAVKSIFLAATEHKCPLLHQATQKGQLRENVALGHYRLSWMEFKERNTQRPALPLLGSLHFCFMHLQDSLGVHESTKEQTNFLHCFSGFICITAIEFRDFFLKKSRFKGLSSSIYFSVTKLPETCSVAVFIFWRRLQVGKRVLGRTYFFTFSWSQCVEIRLTAVLCTSVFSATSSPSINRLFSGKRSLRDTTKY